MAFLDYIINNLNPIYAIICIGAAIFVNIFFGLSSKHGLKKFSIAISVLAIVMAIYFVIYSFLAKGIFTTIIFAFEARHLIEIVLMLFIGLNVLIFLSADRIKEENFIKILIIFLFSLASVLLLILSRNFLAIFIALTLFILSNFQLISGIQGNKSPVYVIKFFFNSLLSLLFLFLGFSFLYAATDFKNLQQIMESGALGNPFYPISLVFIMASIYFYLFLYPFHGSYLKLIKNSYGPVAPLILFYFLPAGLILILKFRPILFYFISNGNQAISYFMIFLAALCTIGPAVGALSTTSLKRIIAFTYLSFMGLSILVISLASGEMINFIEMKWLILFNLLNLVIGFMPVWLIISKLEDSLESLKGFLASNKYVGVNLIIIFLSWLGMAGTSGFLLRHNFLQPYYSFIRGGTLFGLPPTTITVFFIAVLAFLFQAAITIKMIKPMFGKPSESARIPMLGTSYNIYITFFTIIILILGILGLFNIFGLSIFPGLDITGIDFVAFQS